jgi:hypothetical protein
VWLVGRSALTLSRVGRCVPAVMQGWPQRESKKSHPSHPSHSVTKFSSVGMPFIVSAWVLRGAHVALATRGRSRGGCAPQGGRVILSVSWLMKAHRGCKGSCVSHQFTAPERIGTAGSLYRRHTHCLAAMGLFPHEKLLRSAHVYTNSSIRAHPREACTVKLSRTPLAQVPRYSRTPGLTPGGTSKNSTAATPARVQGGAR